MEEFIDQYCQLRGLDNRAITIREENLESETNIQLESKSVGFTKLISSLYNMIELFDFDIEEDNKELLGYGISEKFLRLLIKEDYLLEIREY